MKLIRRTSFLGVFFAPLIFISFLASGQGSGNSITLNGLDQAVDLETNLFDGARTLELWFKPDVEINSSNSIPRTLIGRDFNNADVLNTNEFALYFDPGWEGAGRLSFYRRVGNTLNVVSSNSNLWLVDKWYHVLATIDPIDGMKLYINGVLQNDSNNTTTPIGTSSSTSSDKVSIGKWGNLNIRYFEGEIDELRCWEDARSQEEVRDFMCKKVLGSEDGLRLAWNYDRNSTDVIFDDFFGHNILFINFNNSVITSSAPIGDESNSEYSNDLSNSQISLNSLSGANFVTKTIITSAEGVHIYRVDELPNTVNGIERELMNNYFGVFYTNFQSEYDIEYDVTNEIISCENAEINLYARNDNASLTWNEILTVSGNCILNKMSESNIDDEFRSEYIYSKNLLSFGTKDSIICEGGFYISQQNGVLYEPPAIVFDTLFGFAVGGGDSILFIRLLNNDILLSDSFDLQLDDNNQIFIDLQIDENNISSIEWTGNQFLSCSNCLNPIILKDSINSLNLEIVDIYGCFHEATIILRAFVEVDLFVPNTFTPNNDGVNDIFKIYSNNSIVEIVWFKVFNKWGDLVYDLSNIVPENEQYGWDGTFLSQDLNPGVFAYSIKVLLKDGNERILKGDINLLR